MRFNVEKTIKYWIDGAEYDMETAESLFRAREYPYSNRGGRTPVLPQSDQGI